MEKYIKVKIQAESISLASVPPSSRMTTGCIRNSRLSALILIAAYIGVFDWVYLTYLAPIYGYFGFWFNNPGWWILSLTHLTALVPAFFIPLRLRRPSQLIYWVLYLLAYIPAVLAPSYIQRRPLEEIQLLNGFLLIGFVIIGCSYRFRLPTWKRTLISPSLFWGIFWVMYGALLTTVLNVFWGNIRLVSFGQIYESIRFSSGDLANGTYVNYAVMLLGNVMNPFLMAYGLTTRRACLLFAVGALGQVLLYATGGLKTYVFSVLFILLFNQLLKMKNYAFGHIFSLGLVVSIATFNGLGCLSGFGTNGVLGMANAILLMRILGIGGLNMAIYQDFFSNHPFTYYSHVKGVSSLIKYPYDLDIGREIGLFMSGNIDIQLNANANLWCTDGIAAWGLLGIIFISLFCSFVFWLLDSVSCNHRGRLAPLLCIMPAMLAANTSMFTTLWSGGLGLIIVILFCLPVTEARPWFGPDRG